jgi:hypothetical protein
MMNVPVPFPGTAEEAAANYRTHFFGGIDGRCYDCDSRPSHVAADYPCGTNPPRMLVG